MRIKGALPSFVILALLCVAPAFIGYSELLRNPGAVTLLAQADTWLLFGRTVLFALLSATVATVAGVPLGLSWTAVPRAGRPLLIGLSWLPFLLPPYVYAIACIEIGDILGGPWRAPGEAGRALLYSFWGASIVQSATMLPITAFATWFAFRGSDGEMVAAARLIRGPLSACWSALLPACRVQILGGFVVAFLLSLNAYVIPALLQTDLLSVAIHARFAAQYDVAGAFALTIPTVLCGFLVVSGWWAVDRARGTRSSGWGSRECVSPLPVAPARLYLGGYVILFAVLPIAALMRRIGSVTAVADIARTSLDEIAVSIALAAASVVVAALLALALVPAGRRAARAAAWFAAVPLLLSASAFGIGMILFWNHNDLRGSVYDSGAILVVAESGRVALILIAGAWFGLRIQDPNLEAAARLTSRGNGARFFRIQLPLAAPVLLPAAALAFLFAFGDSGTVALVTPPGATPLPVRVSGLMHYGPSELVSALSLIAAVVSLLVVAMGAWGAQVLARRMW